jgi:hypothetical protein
MHIDWSAILIVAVVSIASSVLFMVLLATGIRAVVSAQAKAVSGGSRGAAQPVGYTLLGLAGLLVLFGLYLIVPQFH